jgi:hypothetical protein
MTTSSYIICLFLAVILIGWVIHVSIERDLGRLEHLEKWSKEFVKNMTQILEHNDLPEGVISDLKFINSLVGHKSSSRFLAFYSIAKKDRSIKNDDKSNHKCEPDDLKYFYNNDSAGKIFVEIFNSALLTISYRSRIFGPVIRFNLLDLFVEKKLVSASKFTDVTKKRFGQLSSTFNICTSS